LAEANFAFTRSLGERNNSKLPLCAYKDGHWDDVTKRRRIYTQKAFDCFKKETIEELSSELLRIDCDNVIFSSEHFHSRLVYEEEIYNLREILEALGMSKFVIVVYLREQGALANSYFSTACRQGYTDAQPPFPGENQHWDHFCNHKRSLDRWSMVFGKNQIIPRIYEKNELLNGTIIDDFLSIIGIEPHLDFVPVHDMNQGISHLGLEILRRINKKIPRHLPNGRPNTARKGILKFVEKHFGGGKYLMSQDLFSAYRAKYATCNEMVRKEYFPERNTLFNIAREVSSTVVDISEDDLQLISDFIVDVWGRDSG